MHLDGFVQAPPGLGKTFLHETHACTESQQVGIPRKLQ